MKIILQYLTLALFVILASCENTTETALEYQFTANVNPATVIQGMKDSNNSNIFSNTTEIQYMLDSYIYDSKGDLVEEKSVMPTSFYDTSKFVSSLPAGSYTAVYRACFYDDSGAVWGATNKSSLYNLGFSVKSSIIGWAHVLGVSTVEFNISSSKEVDVNLEEIGSMLSTTYTYSSSTNVAYIFLEGNTTNNTYSVYDDESNVTVSTNNNYIWSEEKAISKDYVGTTHNFFYLPTENIEVKWVSYDSNFNVVCSGTTTYDSVKNNDTVAIVNVDTGETTFQ